MKHIQIWELCHGAHPSHIFSLLCACKKPQYRFFRHARKQYKCLLLLLFFSIRRSQLSSSFNYGEMSRKNQWVGQELCTLFEGGIYSFIDIPNKTQCYKTHRSAKNTDTKTLIEKMAGVSVLSGGERERGSQRHLQRNIFTNWKGKKYWIFVKGVFTWLM